MSVSQPSDHESATQAGVSKQGATDVSFQSKELEELLNIIDELRSQGISHLIDLPQLIVCGDQSSGKSSVLEAVSGVRFPTKDNLCTRFPTELILRRSPNVSSAVTIVPDIQRPEHEITQLRSWTTDLDILEDFGLIVDAAGREMGLDQASKKFSNDVLRVELTGPKLPHLTLVDLPGLFHAGNKTQSTDDAAAVKSLVTKYMEKPRSVILAVVSAKNDYANQIVTKYANDVDPNGERTLGIITKPDTLYAGSESEKQFVELAQNKDVHLRLGWHVLKNRDFTNKDCSADERDAAEVEFFSTGIWTSLPPTAVGIGSLKPRLSRVLRDQILVELPGLIADIESGIRGCEDRLARLGGPRATFAEQRTYLHQASQRFTELVKAGVEGRYEHTIFQNHGLGSAYKNRIAAVVSNLLDDFSKEMAVNGCRFRVIDDVQSTDEESESGSSTTGEDKRSTPILVTRQERLSDVRTLIKENRGRELPGFPRFENVAMLFREQCIPWKSILEEYADEIFERVRVAIYAFVEASTDPTTSDGVLRLIVDPALDVIKHDIDQRVAANLTHHLNGHPITFNHYFTENLQKLRAGHEEDRIRQRLADLDTSSDNDPSYKVSEIIQAVVLKTEPDMMDFTCSEALHFMEAYYKVALKFTVDDFSIHTITQGLLNKLPAIFDTNRVLMLDEGTIRDLAGETDESTIERSSATHKLEMFKKALQMLRRLDRSRSRKVRVESQD